MLTLDTVQFQHHVWNAIHVCIPLQSCPKHGRVHTHHSKWTFQYMCTFVHPMFSPIFFIRYHVSNALQIRMIPNPDRLNLVCGTHPKFIYMPFTSLFLCRVGSHVKCIPTDPSSVLDLLDEFSAKQTCSNFCIIARRLNLVCRSTRTLYGAEICALCHWWHSTD